MPIHDFHCGGCDHRFERLVRIGETPACPQCGSGEVARQVSLTAPQGRSGELIARARRQAASEGHFSHYSAAEQKRVR